MDYSTLVGTIVAALAVFIPVMAGILQYRQAIQQNMDKNFRTEVEKLTSKNKEERLASATNMGTFIEKGNRFNDEAVNILVNRVSVELDYNVLGAMVVCLRKVEKAEYRNIIQKLVDIDRGFFIRRYPLKKWKEQAEKDLHDVQAEFTANEESHKDEPSELTKLMLENLKKDTNNKWEIFCEREKEFRQLEMHSQAITDFISSFLGSISRGFAISEVEFNQNSLNSAVIENVNLVKCSIEASAFSASNIKDAKFSNSLIHNTVFTFSSIINTQFHNCQIQNSLFDQTGLDGVSFSGCEFTHVFFIGSNLAGANFKHTKGLKPIYFYMANNIDYAIFDKGFGRELRESLGRISEQEFVDYVVASNLTKQRQDAILLTLDEIKAKNR